MAIKISGAPCSWGVDDVKNPYLPSWKRVLKEANAAGYQAIELGPYGYIPLAVEVASEELSKNHLTIVAGTIFDDLVATDNYQSVIKQTRDICELLIKLKKPDYLAGQHFAAPYLTIMDWGHDERDYAAGHYDRAPRLSDQDWQQMMEHIKGICQVAAEYDIRGVIHPHAGGYIEFEDELEKVVTDIPASLGGLCLDTGHLYYSGMDPVTMLRRYQERLDYVHFKDVNRQKYDQVMNRKIRFFDACGQGVMCPIGDGDIDYAGIKKVLTEIEYAGYITIEQERDPRNADGSLEDVKKSVEFLKSIGYQI